MMSRKKDQSVIVSGESGAGKTESCKRVMAYLAHLSTDGSSAGGGSTMSDTEQRVLECNPFLEAFGNAKTGRNNNSSRFGKFINIQYVDNCIAGVEMQHYLLEKSRLVSTAPNERNYHIFCQLCKAATEAALQGVRWSTDPTDTFLHPQPHQKPHRLSRVGCG
jgi:myosin heavy subunit